MIRKLTLFDDLNRVAQIIYQTDASLFPFLFGKKEKAIPHLSKLISLDNNSFSYHNIHIDIEDKIEGIIIELDASKHLDETKDFSQTFSFGQLMMLAIKQTLLFPILKHKNNEGRYIQNVCVDKNSRGKGIGTLLLLNAFDRAKKEGISKLFLDVEVNNKKAIALYENHGFIKQKTKRIWFIFPATYWMMKIL
ncbi:MAG: GNAT family N-acetyltransferase [Bacteroidetes bacterium]|nr:GNAT family N-acetyltransferase [Bacteroidota bacterium]MBU1094369.1 GNAT family N-acetyltransferase [Bacillota bacterium]